MSKVGKSRISTKLVSRATKTTNTPRKARIEALPLDWSPGFGRRRPDSASEILEDGGATMNSISRCLANIVAALLLAAISHSAYAIDVEVELNPDPVIPGGTLRADITISNDTASSIALVTMEATAPACRRRTSLTAGSATSAIRFAAPPTRISFGISARWLPVKRLRQP